MCKGGQRMGAKLAAKVESGRRRGGKRWFSGLRERVGEAKWHGEGGGGRRRRGMGGVQFPRLVIGAASSGSKNSIYK